MLMVGEVPGIVVGRERHGNPGVDEAPRTGYVFNPRK